MSLQIYNTRSKTKELFKSHCEGKVTMYVCGPTVYDLLHIGNFRGVVFFNVVRQWLENSGYEVIFALNYTDIDDKIIKAAYNNKISISDLTKKIINNGFVKVPIDVGMQYVIKRYN